LRVLGDGSQRKSYLHVEDCVRAVLHIGEDLRPAARAQHTYEVHHLGVPAFCTVRESAAWICDELGLEPRLEFGVGNRGWVGDSPFVFLDVAKALATGWTPTHTIAASVRHTVRWLTENRWIFDRR
jgi:UDP-glucose 4-epimerase